jgi:propionaldehyde dehydrogenase
MTMKLNEAEIRGIVQSVVNEIHKENSGGSNAVPSSMVGIYSTIDEAVIAARQAHKDLRDLPLEKRKEMIANVRKLCIENVEEIARMAVAETGMGRVEDKIAKNILAANATPGVEHLKPIAFTGDYGLTLTERAPYGVIGAITPSTNPSETIINNAIGMVAGGNAVVFNAHPGAKNTSVFVIDLINRAIAEVGGPKTLLTAVAVPTMDSATALMHHEDINLLVVTGGGGVVKAAMRSGRKCIAAGPGNPPVVVDATADINVAGIGIVRGASFDNNVICVDEKEVFVVDSVADQLIKVMQENGAVLLKGRDVERLRKLVIHDGHTVRERVGRNASTYLDDLNISYTGDPRLIIAEVKADHDFVQHELLMPILGIVRVPNVDVAIEEAMKAEHGFRHTASMYSRDLDALHKMANAFDGSVFVKNAPNYAGLGFGGEGYTSFTIASPTGEGMTTVENFTRVRRCTLAGYFRIV